MTSNTHVVYVGDEPVPLTDRDDYTVTGVSNAGDVYPELETTSVDCVVCDPAVVQWQSLLERLAQRFGDVPLVLYGDVEEDRVERAREHGVDAFVPRCSGDPFLDVRVRDCIEAGQQQGALTERTNARFRALTENIGVALITIDTDSVVQFANPVVEDVLGWEPSELEGETLVKVIPERFRSRHFEAIEQYLDTGDRSVDWSSVRLSALHRDGHEVPVLVSFGEFAHSGNHYFSGVIAEIRDQPDFSQLHAHLRDARSALDGDADVSTAVAELETAIETIEDRSNST